MYQILHRLEKDGRAPSSIEVDTEYEMGGEIDATTRSEAIRKWHLGKDKYGESVKTPVVGDVLLTPVGDYFIYTATGIWANVSSV